MRTAAAGPRDPVPIAAALACLALGPVTVPAALALARFVRRGWLAALAAPSLLGAALLARRLRAELRALAHVLHARAPVRPVRLEPLLPHLAALWLATAPLAPVVALALLAWRGAGGAAGADPDASARSALDRAERRVVRRAAAPLPSPPPIRDGAVFLGYRLGGDALLPCRRGRVYLPLERLGHHVLVVGATGSGKTETVLRLVESVARGSDWVLVFIDAKGDRETGGRFASIAAAAGRRVWRFPEGAYDGWRGEPGDVAGRLLQLIDFATEGGGAYYRDLAVNAVRLACAGPAGAPRSAPELLRRLTRDALPELHPRGSPAAAEAAAFPRDQLDGIRARYSAFFATVGGALDGKVAFDEVEAAYFRLDGLRLKHEAGYLARFLVEEFTQWAVARKPRERRVLLVVDEFSAIAAAGRGLVDVVERTRAFGVAAVLCPQLAEGMGGPEAAARLIGSAQTILLHATPIPERFLEAAGGRRVAHTTLQLEGDEPTGRGTSRPGRERRVDPDEVRRLAPGQCFAIGSGRALKLQVAPTLSPRDDPAPHR